MLTTKDNYEVDNWNICIKTVWVTAISDVLKETDLKTMEKNKFDENWNIRIVTSH